VIRVPRAESAKRAGEMLANLPVVDITIDEIEATKSSANSSPNGRGDFQPRRAGRLRRTQRLLKFRFRFAIWLMSGADTSKTFVFFLTFLPFVVENPGR
jgi:hypothetical protein